ncbi:hypothetical protein LTR08_001253 [Meristemomyces frigidus]|nr:hypothetical protein LTR08_001253 [Meristemomyces frigidus]
MPHALPSSPPEAAAPADAEDSHMPDAPAARLGPEEEEEEEEEQIAASAADATPDLPALPDATAGAAKSLEDMFDDDSDDDDEFSSSAPVRSSQPAPPSAPSGKPNFAAPDLLRQFYSRLFPFRPLFQWLNHAPAPGPAFQNREFAFVLPGGAYIRYQSFASPDLFRKQCIAMTPERFEIGPQYNVNPRDRKALRTASALKPVSKELVFDIDMTDYDPVRTCCRGAAICAKCWPFITMAIRVVDAALRDDFGFAHILWVYSGRRGAHAWVSDKRARDLDDAKRRALANYLVLVTGNEQAKKTGDKGGIKRPLHPHIDRSLKLLNPYFTSTVLVDQDPWSTTALATEKLLPLLPDAKLTAALQKKWSSSPTAARSSTQIWADIDTVATAGNLSTLTSKQLVQAKQDIRLHYTYPRLDAEVSKKRNHLLKSPFVVHPGTGRVCVPIDVRDLDNFDPFAVPTVTQLLREIDEWDLEHAGMAEEERAKVQDWQRTGLKPYVEFFRGYVAGLLKAEAAGGKRGREGEGMEF